MVHRLLVFKTIILTNLTNHIYKKIFSSGLKQDITLVLLLKFTFIYLFKIRLFKTKDHYTIYEGKLLIFE
jgi:hypothetical protein